jgi:hypothetical protein
MLDQRQDLSGLTLVRVVLTRDVQFPSLDDGRIISIKYGTQVWVDISEDIGWDGGANVFTLTPDCYCISN